MFQTFRNAWKIPDLRKKILYTILIVIIFRIGCFIPVPFLNHNALQNMTSTEGTFMQIFDVMSGGSFSKATLFALSITPYINASIIINLLTVAIPALERLAKEGATGRKKINFITRIASLVLALILSLGYFLTLKSQGAYTISKYNEGTAAVWFTSIVIILAFTAGASLIMWLGEQINDKGIGNGISIILFASIVSRGLDAVKSLYSAVQLGTKYAVLIPVVLLIFIAMIVFVVYITNAERRIPIQYAKRVVGRKMYGGQNTHIPIKIAMNGVMPIIFAMSLMSIPATIFQFTGVPKGGFWLGFYKAVSNTGVIYAVVYFLLIVGFSYFYAAIQYNPIEIANNLRKNNGGIPGIRPGRPTSDFISKVISKITIIGAIFLAIIAILPIVFARFMPEVSGISLGGTTLLILVGVSLETARTLESQMMMRHHKGFLE